jgi:hypothetical protein
MDLNNNKVRNYNSEFGRWFALSVFAAVILLALLMTKLSELNSALFWSLFVGYNFLAVSIGYRGRAVNLLSLHRKVLLMASVLLLAFIPVELHKLFPKMSHEFLLITVFGMLFLHRLFKKKWNFESEIKNENEAKNGVSNLKWLCLATWTLMLLLCAILILLK